MESASERECELTVEQNHHQHCLRLKENKMGVHDEEGGFTCTVALEGVAMGVATDVLVGSVRC
jgi:hypothetical protein